MIFLQPSQMVGAKNLKAFNIKLNYPTLPCQKNLIIAHAKIYIMTFAIKVFIFIRKLETENLINAKVK